MVNSSTVFVYCPFFFWTVFSKRSATNSCRLVIAVDIADDGECAVCVMYSVGVVIQLRHSAAPVIESVVRGPYVSFLCSAASSALVGLR